MSSTSPVHGNRKRGTRTGALLLLAVLAIGCVPFPHMERRASEINGTVVEVGTPLDGVRVKRVLSPYQILPGPLDTSRPLCERPGEEVITDAAGRFHFDEQRMFYPVIVLYWDPWTSITICADVGSGLMEAWHETHLGQTPPRTMRLVCQAEGVRQVVTCHGP